MMQKKAKLVKLCCIVLAAMSFMGCGRKQIFKVEGEEYMLQEVSDDELETGKYYVKDTTKFYAAHEIGGNTSGVVNIASKDRLLWSMQDDSLIPTMYLDGLIAYASNDNVNTEEVNIERFENIGASFGVFGAEIDINGYISIPKNKLVKGTAIYDALHSESADSFTITKIDDKDVTKDMVTSGGVITGLEYGKEYKIEFYSGTYYKNATIEADLHFYRSFEVYKSNNIKPTKNGYISIYMPDDINSGFYRIDGKGFFKYYNCMKDEVTDDIDMNKAYYQNEAEQISAYSQQYMVNISQPTYDVSFTATYDPKSVSDSDVIAVLTSPDGTVYRMAASGGIIAIDLDYAIAGRWTINIVPQALELSNVSAVSTAVGDDATVETYTYELEESTNKLFTVKYSGEGEVWGTVTYEDGTAVEFKNNGKDTLQAEFTYVAAGTYTVNVYHYADTITEEPIVVDNQDALSDLNIVVESD